MNRLFIFIIILVISSCTSIKKSHLNSDLKISVKSNMKARINVDVTRKITGYASGGYLFNIFKVSGDSKYATGVNFNSEESGFFSRVFGKTEKVKAAATYNAIRNSNADVIVSPQYVLEESNWNPLYKLIKVKVVGYPGKIVAIKNE